MSHLQGIIERACKAWFPGERIWTNYRPDWLYGMEIDIFMPDIKLAIEVQGHQHHLFVPDFQDSVDTFKAQVDRDKRKRYLIKQRGIAFFEVPCVNKVMGGLQQKLTNYLHKRLSTPPELKKEWSAHRRYLNTCKNMVRFKLKSGTLIPINKKSAKILKAARKHFPSANSNDKAIAVLSRANNGAKQTTNPATRVRIPQGSPGNQVAERVRLESASPQPAAQRATATRIDPTRMTCTCRSESASVGTQEHPAVREP